MLDEGAIIRQPLFRRFQNRLFIKQKRSLRRYRKDRFLLSYYHHYGGQNYQKSKVESREKTDVLKRFSLDVRSVFSEGNKAGKRGDQSSDSADVYAYKQLSPVFSEFRK